MYCLALCGLFGFAWGFCSGTFAFGYGRRFLIFYIPNAINEGRFYLASTSNSKEVYLFSTRVVLKIYLERKG